MKNITILTILLFGLISCQNGEKKNIHSIEIIKAEARKKAKAEAKGVNGILPTEKSWVINEFQESIFIKNDPKTKNVIDTIIKRPIELLLIGDDLFIKGAIQTELHLPLKTQNGEDVFEIVTTGGKIHAFFSNQDYEIFNLEIDNGDTSKYFDLYLDIENARKDWKEKNQTPIDQKWVFKSFIKEEGMQDIIPPNTNKIVSFIFTKDEIIISNLKDSNIHLKKKQQFVGYVFKGTYQNDIVSISFGEYNDDIILYIGGNTFYFYSEYNRIRVEKL